MTNIKFYQLIHVCHFVLYTVVMSEKLTGDTRLISIFNSEELRAASVGYNPTTEKKSSILLLLCMRVPGNGIRFRCSCRILAQLAEPLLSSHVRSIKIIRCLSTLGYL